MARSRGRVGSAADELEALGWPIERGTASRLATGSTAIHVLEDLLRSVGATGQIASPSPSGVELRH